jgi:hypothetical protein
LERTELTGSLLSGNAERARDTIRFYTSHIINGDASVSSPPTRQPYTFRSLCRSRIYFPIAEAKRAQVFASMVLRRPIVPDQALQHHATLMRADVRAQDPRSGSGRQWRREGSRPPFYDAIGRKRARYEHEGGTSCSAHLEGSILSVCRTLRLKIPMSPAICRPALRHNQNLYSLLRQHLSQQATQPASGDCPALSEVH